MALLSVQIKKYGGKVLAVTNDEGKKKAVLNKKETAIAQSKQEMIKQEFQDWIWSDPERRERLCKSYNEKFNSVRPREYDGSHIIFNGMNPEIELREHQKNAVAHILYGGNTLLAHAVGAGKTFEMVAAAQESKRLGLCNKSLFVVPNHLTEQWAAEYTQYPAHVLRYYPYGRAFTAGGNQAIVEVALTQVGNQGGQPYWSWYGFNSRVEWCACFVSWCADQCGYIESGLVPKFAGCVDGANWFKSNGKWQDRTYEPKAGDIIFFDWEGDGTTDHVGIVEKCENGTVYTVEGNSGDACKQRQYTVGSSNIYGYGIPAY